MAISALKPLKPFVPIAERLFGAWIRSVDRTTLRADALAGVLGALLVLPQAIAFARLAGLPPEYGLYTAVVPCIVAALFGSSRHVVSGPTNANSLALFAVLAPLAAVRSPAYVQLALAVTVLVGVMQWLIGFFRLGTLANFVSPAALHGFTTGAAVLIAMHALPDLLGLPAPGAPGLRGVLLQLTGLFGAPTSAIVVGHPALLHLGAVLVGIVTLGAVPAARRLAPKAPPMLLALVAGSAVAAAFNRIEPWPPGGGVAVLGSLPPIWPRFRWPAVRWHDLPELASIAFALTIVALGQSIAVAKALAARSGQAIDTNREFCGQGLSNIVGGFFSSYVSCGSLNRSLPNLEAGARTPLAAVFASLWLLVLLAAVAPLLGLIALPAIAGLLLAVACSLADLAGWRRLWRYSRADFVIALVTLSATVSIRLEMAILLGTVLSLVTYLHRTSRPSLRSVGFDSAAPDRPFVVRADVPSPLPECPQLKMVRMEGEVYFGAVPHVAEQLREMRAQPGVARHLLVMAKSMNFIDLAAADLWRAELLARRAVGGDLYFHRPRTPVLGLWRRIGFLTELGPDHVFPDKRTAIEVIFERLDRSICAGCRVRVFEECRRLPPPRAPGGT